MEASEKPQLPLDGAVSEGTVRALDDRLVIEQLTVTDERAAQLVRDRQKAGQEPARTVSNAIEIGARVLDREDSTAEVDFVRAEFERQASASEGTAHPFAGGRRPAARRADLEGIRRRRRIGAARVPGDPAAGAS